MKNLFFTIIFSVLILPPASVFAACETGSDTSISQYGITWTFDREYQCGQFVNGDYWVLDEGEGVVVTGISNNHHPGVDLSSVDYDGSSLNCNWTDEDGTPPQGWDSRMPGYDQSYNINHHLPYSFRAGNSLMTAESWLASDPDRPLHDSGRLRPSLKLMVILTAVSEDPGTQAFRPSYAKDQKIIYAANHDRYAMMPSLAAVENLPNLNTTYENVKRPWVDLMLDWSSEYWRPSDNYGSIPATDGGNYQARIANKYSSAILLAMTDLGEGKDQLLNYLIQIGIDYYGLHKNGAIWPSNGGHAMGYKLPILFSGVMLEDSAMLGIGDLPVNHPGLGLSYFGDDGSTFYISQADVDITNSDQWDPDERASVLLPYKQEDIGLAEWGIRYSVHPEYNNAHYSAPYRTTYSPVMVGQVLAARMMGLQDEWGHDATFDYIDRYSTWPGESPFSVPYMNRFVANMWNAYRDLCDNGSCLQEESVAIIRHDVDQNGLINSLDALLVLRKSLGLSMVDTAWQDSLSTGDVDCNDSVSSSDALLILRHSLGLDMSGTTWCD